MIAADVYARLSAAITADVSGRIYAGVAPQDPTTPLVTPLCVYNVLSRAIDHTLDGPTTLRHTHVQVDIYAATFSIASPIAEKVVTSFGSWRDTVDANALTVTVDDAGTDMVENSVKPELKRVSMRFIVHHYGP